MSNEDEVMKESLYNKFRTYTHENLSHNSKILFDSWIFQTSSEGYRPHISEFNSEKIGISLDELWDSLEELQKNRLVKYDRETSKTNINKLGWFYKTND